MKKHLIKCSEVAKHICDNLDSQLDTPKCRAIRKHIHECPNCYAYLDSVKKTVHLYRVEPAPYVSAKAHRKLMAILKLK
ncbi:MAG: zf-HC2 domain-containing protein [Bacteroidetes bacterium]|jgi:anti-sigma factor RsiW|nr:zf-HC2 domain-containing protein [Bacteroidota bacterium]